MDNECGVGLHFAPLLVWGSHRQIDYTLIREGCFYVEGAALLVSLSRLLFYEENMCVFTMML